MKWRTVADTNAIRLLAKAVLQLAEAATTEHSSYEGQIVSTGINLENRDALEQLAHPEDDQQ